MNGCSEHRRFSSLNQAWINRGERKDAPFLTEVELS
jgi:hypothetical protein